MTRSHPTTAKYSTIKHGSIQYPGQSTAGSGIAFVGASSATTGATNQLTVPMMENAQEGHTLILVAASRAVTTLSSPGFNSIQSSVRGTALRYALFWQRIPSTVPTSVTVNATANALVISALLLCYSGVAATSPVGAGIADANASSGTNSTFASINAEAPGIILFADYLQSNSPSYQGISGATPRVNRSADGSTGLTLFALDKTVSAGSTGSFISTHVSVAWAALAITLKAA